MSALEIVSINPPIRGSIVKIGYDETLTVALECINPPIRGSIVAILMASSENLSLYQSPYKGFNSCSSVVIVCMPLWRINPPIRGSIEQDNALFRNYNHKR